MDLDRDGRVDVLSGSYQPGALYLFAGREQGGFAAPRVLTLADGAELLVGRASWPFACDWEGDGDLDLVLGNMYGKLFLARNTSGSAVLALDPPQPLRVGGVALELTETNAAPCVADWDGDGAADLLLGTGAGRVLLYRNATRGPGEPELGEPLELVAASPDGSGVERLRHPGRRARLALFDWNADGLADLVVGEHAAEDGPAPVLDAAGQRELAAIVAQREVLDLRRSELERAAFARWIAERGIPPAEAGAQHDAFLAVWLETPEIQALSARQAELAAKHAKLGPELREHGRLWVFLRERSRDTR